MLPWSNWAWHGCTQTVNAPKTAKTDAHGPPDPCKRVTLLSPPPGVRPTFRWLEFWPAAAARPSLRRSCLFKLSDSRSSPHDPSQQLSKRFFRTSERGYDSPPLIAIPKRYEISPKCIVPVARTARGENLTY